MGKDDSALIIGGLIAAVLGYFGLNYFMNNNKSTQTNTGSNLPGPPSSSSGGCSKCPFDG